MKKQKLTIMLSVIYAIIFAVLNVIVFVVFKPGKIENDVAKKAFWFSYGFMVLSFLLQFATIFVFDRKRGIDAVFMGMPLYVISAIFFAVELFVSVVFMTLGAFNVQVPTALVIVLQIVILAAYLVVAILAIMVKDHISAIDEKIVKNVTNIRNLTADVELAMEACNDPELKNTLRIFSEDIRYSDPMTVPEVAAIDVELETAVKEIKNAAYDGNYELVGALVRKAKLILSERNKKISNCK